MKLSRFTILLTGLAYIHASAQFELVPGKTTEKPAALTKKEEAEYKYEPVDPEFWAEVEEILADQNYSKLVVKAADVIEDEKNSGSDEAEEAKLALSIGLSRLGLSYGSSVLLMELAKARNGTKIGEAALSELSKLASKKLYEKEDLTESLFISTEFGPMHSSIESFVGFHSGLYSLTAGFKEWSDKEFKKVKPNSYWDYQLRYLKALGEVARERFDSATKLLDELKESQDLDFQLKQKVILQLARLKFEQGDFDTAYKYYYGLDLPIREKGRVYLERAWTKFYQRDYAKALGLIAVHQSPLYAPSLSPESYVLKMLVYRELCHYESVVETAQDFRSRFGISLREIKDRKPLEKNYQIASLVLLNERFQYWANFIQQLREESHELEDYNWSDYPFFNKLVQAYKKHEQLVQGRINKDLDEAARKVANDILDAEDQVNYLDYAAKLDSLRIVRRGENRDYKPEAVPLLTFEKFFWPIDTEHWTDELEDYTVLIKSRCGESQLTPKSGEDSEFEGEFK